MTASVETDCDGPVVIKRGQGDDAERLRLEGERLARARHPGVVGLVRSGAVGDGWELCTRHAGRSVASLGALTAPQVAGIAAGVAATLADLHELGLAHGRIDGSHVLVGDQGRPVLCGFGAGDPTARPEDDVAGLGALLTWLLGTDESGEPIPEQRWWGRRAWSGWERRALLLLADQSVADPPTCRPTARRLAAAIAEAVPAPARPGDPHLEGDPIERLRAASPADPPSPARLRRAVALGLAGAVLLAAGAHQTLRGDRPPSAGRIGPAAATSTPVDPPAPSPEVRTAVSIAGGELFAGGRRYRVGQEGDEVLVDDWDCDGEAAPALLRPGTGEVFVFPRWIDEGTLVVEPVLEVVGAEALVSEAVDGSCPALRVRTTGGELLPVPEAVR